LGGVLCERIRALWSGSLREDFVEIRERSPEEFRLASKKGYYLTKVNFTFRGLKLGMRGDKIFGKDFNPRKREDGGTKEPKLFSSGGT